MSVKKALLSARLSVLNYLQTTNDMNVIKTQYELGDAHKTYTNLLKTINERTNLKRYYTALTKSLERELSIIESLFTSAFTSDAKAFNHAADAYLSKLQGEIEIGKTLRESKRRRTN
ncbi:hypothetical protein ACWV26_17755 [Rummeliibacillus sp. JY-2-4R]